MDCWSTILYLAKGNQVFGIDLCVVKHDKYSWCCQAIDHRVVERKRVSVSDRRLDEQRMTKMKVTGQHSALEYVLVTDFVRRRVLILGRVIEGARKVNAFAVSSSYIYAETQHSNASYNWPNVFTIYLRKSSIIIYWLIDIPSARPTHSRSKPKENKIDTLPSFAIHFRHLSSY